MKCFLILFFLYSISVKADIILPAVISNNMVLQQKSKVKLWGWGHSNEKIYITPSWNNKTDSLVVGADSKWTHWIETPTAGGPFEIKIKGNNTLILSNILIGEVWLCSGQSNMEMSVNWGLSYEEEAKKATNDNIRFFHVSKITSDYPQDDLKARWNSSTPATMRNFSAVAYFFAQRLQQEMNVPVGLINASWGGTPAEVWTPEGVITADSILNDAASKLAPNSYCSVKPGDNYNAMIHPLTNFKIAGALWYQGESNVGQSSYGALFKSMILSWRDAWDFSFPFYFVQIAPWSDYDNNISAPLLRESQTKVLDLPNTGMVLTSDLVDDINDIHPKLKKEVGVRLANYALAETYEVKNIAYEFPKFKELRIYNKRAIISFDGSGSGLVSKSGATKGFYIAGEDKKFVPAKATIRGEKIIVWSDAVKAPVAVRYGFTKDDLADVFSKEGLPLNIFRTDNWTVNTR